MNRQVLDKGWLFRGGRSLRWTQRTLNDQDPLVDLPHDFRIAFDREEDNIADGSEGFYPGGFGQYQKTITLDEAQAGGAVYLSIDGAYRFAEVRVNRQLLCLHKGGYSPFLIDLTGKVKAGENIIHITTSCAMLPGSRWYTGAGLYRGVQLLTSPLPCASPWGVSVKTLSLQDGRAVLSICTDIIGSGEASHEIFAPDGTRVAASMDGSVRLDACSPWSDEAPNLYTLKTTISNGGTATDEVITRFGIRVIAVDSVNGLRINGEKVLLRGGCIHHDNGILGSVSTPDLERRKIVKLKQAGFNAVRCSHNPPSTALLDICDELGMYVMDEAFDAWREGKRQYDEHIFFEEEWESEIHAMVMRDRNHPSIIMWSIGNEIYERSGASDGVKWAHRLADCVRKLDDTRPVTSALCNFFEDPDVAELALNSMNTVGEGKDYWATHSQGYCAALDIVGYNYLLDRYAKDAHLFPARVICGTESFPIQAKENWDAVVSMPHVIGDFVWTAWDYLGESGLGRSNFSEDGTAGVADYPWNIANCGDIDILGNKRPQSHYRDFVWSARVQPYMATQHPEHFNQKEGLSAWGWEDVSASWNYRGHENMPVRVSVYSAGDSVELYANGELCGKGGVENYKTVIETTYKPGEIVAVSLKNGKELGRTALQTSGEAAAFALDVEPSYGGEYRFIHITAVDANGLYAPDFAQKVSVEICGAQYAALGSANPKGFDNYTKNEAVPFNGKLLLVLKHTSADEIKITCKSQGITCTKDVLIP